MLCLGSGISFPCYAVDPLVSSISLCRREQLNHVGLGVCLGRRSEISLTTSFESLSVFLLARRASIAHSALGGFICC